MQLGKREQSIESLLVYTGILLDDPPLEHIKSNI